MRKLRGTTDKNTPIYKIRFDDYGSKYKLFVQPTQNVYITINGKTKRPYGPGEYIISANTGRGKYQSIVSDDPNKFVCCFVACDPIVLQWGTAESRQINVGQNIVCTIRAYGNCTLHIIDGWKAIVGLGFFSSNREELSASGLQEEINKGEYFSKAIGKICKQLPNSENLNPVSIQNAVESNLMSFVSESFERIGIRLSDLSPHVIVNGLEGINTAVLDREIDNVTGETAIQQAKRKADIKRIEAVGERAAEEERGWGIGDEKEHELKMAYAKNQPQFGVPGAGQVTGGNRGNNILNRGGSLSHGSSIYGRSIEQQIAQKSIPMSRMICPYCKAEVEKSNYCSSCGKPLPQS